MDVDGTGKGEPSHDQPQVDLTTIASPSAADKTLTQEQVDESTVQTPAAPVAMSQPKAQPEIQVQLTTGPFRRPLPDMKFDSNGVMNLLAQVDKSSFVKAEFQPVSPAEIEETFKDILPSFRRSRLKVDTIDPTLFDVNGVPFSAAKRLELFLEVLRKQPTVLNDQGTFP